MIRQTITRPRYFWTVEAAAGDRHPAAPGEYRSEESARRALARIPGHVSMFYKVKAWRFTPPTMKRRRAM